MGKSYDLLGDDFIELINIPGHADGLFAVKVKNEAGKYVLLFSDGGYARKSWEEMIPPVLLRIRSFHNKGTSAMRGHSGLFLYRWDIFS